MTWSSVTVQGFRHSRYSATTPSSWTAGTKGSTRCHRVVLDCSLEKHMAATDTSHVRSCGLRRTKSTGLVSTAVTRCFAYGSSVLQKQPVKHTSMHQNCNQHFERGAFIPATLRDSKCICVMVSRCTRGRAIIQIRSIECWRSKADAMNGRGKHGDIPQEGDVVWEEVEFDGNVRSSWAEIALVRELTSNHGLNLFTTSICILK